MKGLRHDTKIAVLVQSKRGLGLWPQLAHELAAPIEEVLEMTFGDFCLALSAKRRS